jgi:hypothetical protein
LESNQPEELGRKITPGALSLRTHSGQAFTASSSAAMIETSAWPRKRCALPAQAKAHARSHAKRTKENSREPKELASGAVERIRQWT